MDRAPIGEVAAVRSGYSFKSKDWLDSGVPVIKIGNVKSGWLTLDGCSFVSEATAQEARSFELQPGNILISMTGNIGEIARVRSEGRLLLNQRVGRFTVRDRTRLDEDYFYYCLQATELKESIVAHAYGAAQPNISPSLIEQHEIPLPELSVQRRIAGILSAYDDLIENSRRRVRILETMAANLYREWFIHTRPPGNADLLQARPTEDHVPRGWKICALGDVVRFKSGFTFKSESFTDDGEHRLVTIRNVQDGAFNPICESRISEVPRNMPPHCLITDGDILLSLTGNVGRVCLVFDGPFLLNQRVSKLSPVEDFDWAMTYCLFRVPGMRAKLEQLANGVAQQNLSPVLASKMEFVCPPRELRQQFAQLAEPTVRRIVRFHSTMQNLHRTRDLLLPHLLSGRLTLGLEPA